MKDIKLIRLKMENFKRHKSLEIDFNGRNAVISGKNGTGKSSVYDALMWVLFGKNSQGKSEQSFEVKPLGSDGDVLDHNALTSVEAVLDVNGEELTLLRTYREKWETRRGSSEAVFTGNTSLFYIDGVPVNKTGFQEKVNQLVDEDTFRLLTSTTYFANDISWQERRSVLFKVAGVMDDNQILATNAQFAPLVDSMGKLSLEDYKKKLLAEKKKFTGAKTEIPARISECQKTIGDIEGLDFSGAKAQVDALNAKKETTAAQLLALDNDNAAQQKSLEIKEAQLELSKLEAENQAYRDRQTVGSVDVHSLNIRITSLEMQLNNRQSSYASLNTALIGYDSQVTECRSRWKQVNSDVFSGGTCVSCGQVLPADKLSAAIAAFEANKKQRLHEIEKTADACKESRVQAEKRIAELQEEIKQTEVELTELQAQIAAAEAAKVEPKDMADFAQRKGDIQARIDKLNDDLLEIHESVASVRSNLRQEVTEISAQISEHMAIISKESLLDYSRKRVQELREDAKNAAECLEAIEKMLYLLHEYSVYKTQFVEDSINGLFRIARFRLFREQANGGIEDRCDVVCDGVVYGDVNTGMKINLGIDIINTLSTAYGVRVPLFVDNSESITEWEKFNGQFIRLEARKEDKELRVNYEN